MISYYDQMETFSTSLALCEGNPSVTDGFSSKRPVRRGFDVFFYLGLNKWLSKHSRRRWFETPSRSFWRYCNELFWSHGTHYDRTWYYLSEGNRMITVGSPHKVPVMPNLNVFFDVSPQKLLNKHSSYMWFQTPWHYCNEASLAWASYWINIRVTCGVTRHDVTLKRRF